MRHSPANGVVAVVDPVGSGGNFGIHARAIGMAAIAVFTRTFEERYLLSTFNPADYDVVLRHRLLDETIATLRHHAVVAVVPAFQTAIGLADLLASELGVVGNPIATSVERRNKTEMKRAWTEHEVACAGWTRAHSADEALGWASRRLPVVMKPEGSAGGFNVFVCHQLDEVVRAYEQISTMPQPFGPPSSAVLVEEFLDGDEYFVDLVHSVDSVRPEVLCLARYDKTPHPTKASICRGFRSLKLDDPAFGDAINYVIKANEAIDVRVGVNDTEFILTSQGPRVVEINNRLPGASTPQMIEVCTGVSPYQEAIRVFAAQPSRGPYVYHKNFAVCCLVNQNAGRATDIRGLDQIKQLPSYSSSLITARQGEFVPETLDLFTTWGTICLTNADYDQLSDDIANVHRLAQLLTEQNHDEHQ